MAEGWVILIALLQLAFGFYCGYRIGRQDERKRWIKEWERGQSKPDPAE